MIKSIRNHGFSFHFDNRFTVQVQYSKHHSGSRYQAKDKGGIYDDINNDGEICAQTAEVVVTDAKGKVVVFNGETSLKYQTSNDVAQILFKASIARVASDMIDFDLSHIKKTEEWE